jgi:hypothetical protein
MTRSRYLRSTGANPLVLFWGDRDGCPGDVFVHEEGGYTCTVQAIRLMMCCGAIMSGSGDGEMGEFFEMLFDGTRGKWTPRRSRVKYDRLVHNRTG